MNREMKKSLKFIIRYIILAGLLANSTLVVYITLKIYLFGYIWFIKPNLFILTSELIISLLLVIGVFVIMEDIFKYIIEGK